MSARLGLNLERQQHRSRRRWSGNLFAVALLSTALTQSLNWANCVVANETRHIKATAYYYPDKFYERNGLARPENIDFTKISRVNYASFQLDFDGNIWGTVSMSTYPVSRGFYLSDIMTSLLPFHRMQMPTHRYYLAPLTGIPHRMQRSIVTLHRQKPRHRHANITTLRKVSLEQHIRLEREFMRL